MAFTECIVLVDRSRIAVVTATALCLCGCAVIGPRSITAGRGVYAEVINRTEDEQILNVIVRQRYDQTFGMLSVSSITANLRFTANVGSNVGIGESENYAGNLVPLSAGVAYEENPTISYVPLAGEDFMRRMLSPIAIKEWLLIGGPIRQHGRLLDLAVRRVNGLRNPPLDGERSPEFTRFLELYDRLRRAGVLDIVQAPETGSESDYYWEFHDYADAYGDAIRELFDLIGIEAQVDGSAIVLPLRMAVGRSASAVNLDTRSAYDILRAFGTGVAIPEPHLVAGIVEPNEVEIPEARRLIAIRSSKKRPKDATVRIRFRGWWFYIDARDAPSKRGFLFLRTFIGMRLADPAAFRQAPVLTVPVN